MKFVAMVTRTLKPGKTYEDYRKTWFHTVGFGAKNIIQTIVNINNPREIISIGYTDVSEEELKKVLDIDVAVRSANPLDDIVESTIVRHFGVMVASDDFSATGKIDYVPPSVDGKPTDYNKIVSSLAHVKHEIEEANKKRHQLNETRKSVDKDE